MSDSNNLRAAVIGVGYLGERHAEKYMKASAVTLVAVSDVNKERCDEIASKHGVDACYDYTKLVGKVDVVSIVTQTVYHYEVAAFFLEHGVHVLIEKPITATLEQAEKIVALADQKGLVLQVGHVERFNSVINAVQSLTDRPYFIESRRLSIFPDRSTDVSVILDLMIHDIDIIRSIVNSEVKSTKANGACVLTKKVDVVNVRIEYENGCVANLVASRINHESERRMKIFQSNAYFDLDLQTRDLFFKYEGDLKNLSPYLEIDNNRVKLPRNDALFEEIQSFVDAVHTGAEVVVSGYDGLNSLKTALEVSQELDLSGNLAMSSL